MFEKYKLYIDRLQAQYKYRQLLPEYHPSQLESLNNANILDFSTNDYLNLSENLELVEATITAVKTYGVGATGSRLLSGNKTIFTQFERQIATDKGEQASLIFATGYQANLSVLSALLDQAILGQTALLFFDRLNHASLYQAAFLAQANLIRYRHNDAGHLESLLMKYKNSTAPKFIVSETIFGMDGDIAPLADLADLAARYDCFLYLDEAHATGVFGRDGYGLSTTIKLEAIAHLIMGTFSKALGCSGAYITSDKIICDYLVNKAKGFIYSTAPSPAATAGAFAAWKMLKNMQNERQHLLNLASKLRHDLQSLGFDIGTSKTHIIPIILGDEKKVLGAKELLQQNNIIVSAVRPPTVPPAGSRLRIALTAKHTQHDIKRLLDVIQML